jgi:hypothetical protein
MPFLRARVLFVLTSFMLVLLYFKSTFKLAATIFSLQVTWRIGSSQFYISEERDGFDVTFANYSVAQETALPEYLDLAPSILHQIALGHNPEHASWLDARNACLELHPD